MRPRYLLLSLVAAVLTACQVDPGPTAPPTPAPADPVVLLKDIEVQSLPSPYYHFAYDASNRISAVSYASGLRSYDVAYDGDQLREMRNDALGNRDRLSYFYDAQGRVSTVLYADSTGVVFTRISLSYDGPLLTGLRRIHTVDGIAAVEKTMAFSYYPDGNVLEVTEHLPAIAGRQDEATFVDRYEQYDDKINVDGFSLIHDDFFDHLVLLPGVQLQKGNPARVIRTGDGINFSIDYRYTYDDQGRPLTKTGAFTLTNGADAGRQFESGTVFSYY